MTFKKAVESTPDVKDAWNPGLQALRASDRRRLLPTAPRDLTGSVDLDTTLRNAHPNAARWDYAIGYRLNSREMIYWVEVHPATDGEISVVLNKFAWLTTWLSANAKQLNRFSREFVWISSSRASFTPLAPQAKRLASSGIRHVGRRFRMGD